MVTPPLGCGGDRFYDDNAWLGLALVRHHELTNDAGLLRLAERVFSFVVSGWSTEASWQIPGGIRWKEPANSRSRNTCANGPAAALAARLHDTTGDTTYLDWAVRAYEWTRRALRGPDCLYADRIAPDGARTPTIWSYNQGSMIGAGVLLAGQTMDSSFVDQAAATAAAYTASRDVDALMSQDPAFNAVLFRNLLLLDHVRPDDRYPRAARDVRFCDVDDEATAARAVRRQRSPLNNAAAMVQIYAVLAGAQPHP